MQDAAGHEIHLGRASLDSWPLSHVHSRRISVIRRRAALRFSVEAEIAALGSPAPTAFRQAMDALGAPARRVVISVILREEPIEDPYQLDCLVAALDVLREHYKSRPRRD